MVSKKTDASMINIRAHGSYQYMAREPVLGSVPVQFKRFHILQEDKRFHDSHDSTWQLPVHGKRACTACLCNADASMVYRKTNASMIYMTAHGSFQYKAGEPVLDSVPVQI